MSRVYVQVQMSSRWHFLAQVNTSSPSRRGRHIKIYIFDSEPQAVVMTDAEAHPAALTQTINHRIVVEPKGVVTIFRMIVPPLLFGISVAAMIRTNGAFGQINYSVAAFAVMCMASQFW